jgi:hypothetical protein
VLHDLQREFSDVALTNSVAALLPQVTASRGSRKRRLGVYHANTVNSLTDVLSAAYPVVQRIVGDRFFNGLAKEFIEMHPPRQPTLFRYGGALADFLGGFVPAKDLPYLVDVARLEWARIDAYFAADRTPLDPQRLADVPPEQIGDLKFIVQPAHQLLESAFPIFTIWAMNQPNLDSVPEINFTHGECGFVSRLDNIVIQRALSIDTLTWLGALAEGKSLGAATELAMGCGAAFDLQNTLRQQLADGTFSDFHV